MKVKKWEKNICCILATILLFLGMSVEVSTTDSSFLRTSSIVSTTETMLDAAETGITSPAVCTLNMIKGGSQAIRNIAGGTFRWQNKVYFSVFFLAACLLYRSIYQSSESKEDGQLFLCRSVIVDYIHQKDSGE